MGRGGGEGMWATPCSMLLPVAMASDDFAKCKHLHFS